MKPFATFGLTRDNKLYKKDPGKLYLMIFLTYVVFFWITIPMQIGHLIGWVFCELWNGLGWSARHAYQAYKIQRRV